MGFAASALLLVRIGIAQNATCEGVLCVFSPTFHIEFGSLKLWGQIPWGDFVISLNNYCSYTGNGFKSAPVYTPNGFYLSRRQNKIPSTACLVAADKEAIATVACRALTVLTDYRPTG